MMRVFFLLMMENKKLSLRSLKEEGYGIFETFLIVNVSDRKKNIVMDE